MSKFKVTFTLKQHTPIIHFQANQSGATLRATELKPKFDKFLKEYVFDNDFEKYKKFLIGYKEPKNNEKPMTKKDFEGKEAFDYKVKIENIANFREIKIGTFNSDIIGSYFGNYKAIEFDKKSNEHIKVEIICFKNDLLKIIKDNFGDFITYESFGTRTSKGFGCFSLSNQEINLKRGFNVIKIFKSKKPLEKILEIHQIAKSGLNHKSYIDSKLKNYFIEKKNIRWEKRYVKKELAKKNKNMFDDLVDNYHKKNDFNFQDSEKYQFIRAILGLFENLEFQTYSSRKLNKQAKDEKDQKKKKVLKKKANGQKIIINFSHIKEGNFEIERFKSPIIYKVFNDTVYVCLKSNIINEKIFNTSFNIKAYYKKDSKNERKKIDLGNLNTPNINTNEFIQMIKTLY